jgi:serine/threonine protein kinase
MTCPAAETLLGFMAGELEDERAAVIEAHLDECAECRAALSSFARGEARPTYGRYRLDTVIGSGGMGIVYRAWDPELSRPVAIKVLHRSDEDTLGRARLVREARSLARLSHPNVCHVYDVGSDGDEVWVAMELIDGVTLREWASEARTARELLDVLLGAAEGLAAAHDAGLVHRDVKPENVLVTRDARAIVTDFGLARPGDRIDPAGPTVSTDPNLTASGAISGTPAYLAPEQLGGDPIDARVDQFAWAVMAWELLTGARPFPVVLAVRLDAIRAGVTPPPSLSARLAGALARALSASPRDRFDSMRELITRVREAPAVATRRRPRVAVVVATIALAAGGVAVVWQGHARVDRDSTAAPTSATPPPTAPPATAAPLATAAAPAVRVAPPPVNVAATPAGPTPPIAAAPHAPKPAPAAITTALPVTRAPAAPPLPSVDPRYSRGRALATLTTMCSIPIDFAHPDRAHADNPIADWGKVIRVEDEVGHVGGRPESLHLIYVQGQRQAYKFNADLGPIGVVPARPGDLLAFCAEDASDVYQLPSGPMDRVLTAVTLTAPPRMSEAAALSPLLIREITMIADLQSPRPRLDPSGRYLYRAQVKTVDGKLAQMDRYWLELPAKTPGAGLVAANKQLWFVVENLRRDDDASGKRFVVTAVAVFDELFP